MTRLRQFLVAICFVLVNLVSGLSIQYCSSLNTAEGGANSSQYQSNGLCFQYCVNNYAFAINQGYDCWCSNIAPGETVSLDECDSSCPGFPTDICGGDNLFAYQALSLAPSGTSGGSSAAPTSSPAKPSPPPVSVTSSSDAYPADPTPDPTPDSTSDSSSSSATWTPTPVISLETITGQVKTVTITPTVPPNSQSLGAVSSKKGGSGLGTGGAVGLAVGLIAAAALVFAAIIFCIRKKRKPSALVSEPSDSGSPRGSSAGLDGKGPSRTMSEHSRYMLGTDGRTVVETWEPDEEPSRPTRRSSALMAVDQRLDPYGPLYMHGSKSGESINTIRDDKDYSRRVQPNGPILRMTNPD